MVAWTLGAKAGDATDNVAVTTGSFTPANGDLLIAFGQATGQAGGGTFSDSAGLGWTQVAIALRSSSLDSHVCAVANALSNGSALTVTFTPAGGPASTGASVFVMRLSGMAKTGLAAVRQFAIQENQSSIDPSVTLPTTPSPVNPLIGSVDFATGGSPVAPAGPPAWTDRGTQNISPPSNQLHVDSLDNGWTSAIVGWGDSGLTPVNFSAIAIELNANNVAHPWFMK